MRVRLALKILDVDQEYVDITLSSNSVYEDEISWEKMDGYPAGPDYALTIITDNKMSKVISINKGSNIMSSNDDIIDSFLEELFDLDQAKRIDESDGFEHIHGDEETLKDSLEMDPYDPKLIRVDPKNFPILQVNGMIQNKEMDIAPDFQREFVWNDITRKSRLIESLLLRIPLPMFYVSQDEEGLFKVVDGIQRLTVINSYMNNEFRLKNLEYLTDCEGKWYKNISKPIDSSLSPLFVRRIEQTQLYFNVIDPQTPSKVKFDIFKRINTGGKSLNAQEIRNCLASGETRKFLKELAESKEFLQVTKGSISRTRMADKELVLRFIAFYFLDNGISNRKDYKNGMDIFLDETMEILNKIKDKKTLGKVKEDFITSMNNASILFGDKAFRKVNLINKSLFLSLSRNLYNYETKEISLMKLGDKANKKLDIELKQNTKFSDALSMATNDARNVEISYVTIKNILKELLE